MLSECTVNTTKNTIVVHDGQTVGGFELASIQYVTTNLANKANSLSGYGIVDSYTKTETNTLLNEKATLATTLSGYGIVDSYTATYIDAIVGAKADIGTTIAPYDQNVNVEFQPGYTRSGLPVYGMLINAGYLPSTGTSLVPIPGYAPQHAYWLADGSIADDTITIVPIPYFNATDGTISVRINNGNLELTTSSPNYTRHLCSIVLHYTKDFLSFVPGSNNSIPIDLMWGSYSSNLELTSFTSDLSL